MNENIGSTDRIGFQLAFDVTGDPEFPEREAFEIARELGLPVTTHAGVWGATNDDGIRLMHDNGFMTSEMVYVHAATLSDDSYQRIAATGGSVSLSTESEQSCGQGYPPSWTPPPARGTHVALSRHQRLVFLRPIHRDALHPWRRPGVGACQGSRNRRHRHPLTPTN